MCAKAYKALTEAGYKPEIKKVYGSGFFPSFLQTSGRRKLKTMTGEYFTPVLELENGSVISTSDDIVAWSSVHPKKTKLTN
jgi:hypothetical protein